MCVGACAPKNAPKMDRNQMMIGALALTKMNRESSRRDSECNGADRSAFILVSSNTHSGVRREGEREEESEGERERESERERECVCVCERNR